MTLEDDDDEAITEEWLSCAEAAERVGRSKRWVQVRAEDGSLTSRVVGRGRQYLASSLDALVDVVSDSAASEKPDVWLLTQTQKHAARSAELLMQGLRFVVDTDAARAVADRDEMSRLRSRIKELEEKVSEQQAAAEAALSEQTARFVAEVQAVAKAEQSKLLLEKAFSYVPMLIGNQRVTQLIASLSADQLALLKAVTTESQFKHIEGIHNEFKQKPESEPESESQQGQRQSGGSAGAGVCDAAQSVGQAGGKGPVDEGGGRVEKSEQSGHSVDSHRDGAVGVDERHGDGPVQACGEVRDGTVNLCCCGHADHYHSGFAGACEWSGCSCASFSCACCS